ncbi:MAG: hypothetical protein KF753_18310 [Caldilineaceae bacterium]|nr:hypothetical protein [Caldilineaceae bacterium]
MKATLQKKQFFAADENKMYLCKVNKKTGETHCTLVAWFTASVVEVIVEEDGSETYRVAGRGERGGPFACEIAAQRFNNNFRVGVIVGAAAGPLDPIAAGMKSRILPAIRELTRWDDLPRTTRKEGYETNKTRRSGTRDTFTGKYWQ